MRRLSTLLGLTLLVTPLCLARRGIGQTDHMSGMEAHAKTKAVPSTSLTITEPDGKQMIFTPADLKAMPHKSVTVMNSHTKTQETYSGVPLTDLLAKLGVPVGKDLKGAAYVTYIVAEGTDHYRALYSLDEIDSIAHQGDVIVADTMNNASLEADGALKLVSTEDKRPARWVRNLTSITVKVAE